MNPKLRIALTRPVSPAIARCELSHLERTPIDARRAAAQHRNYACLLEALGCELRELVALPDHPDGVFVEDTAVVLQELAILARPGAASRRFEVDSTRMALEGLRRLRPIQAPATLDGGDVLVVGRRIFVGQSARTNHLGIEQTRTIVEPLDYHLTCVPVERCLHLKSAVSAVDDRTLLINPRWAESTLFREFELIEIDPREPFAANALRLGPALVYPSAFPRTRERLLAAGLDVHTVDLSELAKAEGAVTCCSLIVERGRVE